MDWKAILGGIAPTLATALVGPLGGMAVSAIGGALGLSNATQDQIKTALTSGQMTGDQVAAIKQAEIAFQTRLKELEIDLEKINQADRDSARQMQTSTKSRIPASLAILVTIGFFGILGALMDEIITISDNPALTLLLGSLSTSWGAIINFYFGSSHGSEMKNDLLSKK